MTTKPRLTRAGSSPTVRPVPNEPGSPWFSTPQALRHRKQLCITLSDEERKEIERVAGKYSVPLSRAIVAAFALLHGRTESEIAAAMRDADEAAPRGGYTPKRKKR